MKCEHAQESVVLAVYGELPDESAGSLDRHLAGCEICRRELNSLRALDEYLSLHPVIEPSPNLLAQSRLRLDDALDHIPPHGFLTRLRASAFGWLNHMQSAPALMTLLLGVGFLAGNFTYRYQVAHQPKSKVEQANIETINPMRGTIANVTGVVRTANPEIVQVQYNRIVPASMEGSLDSKDIRELLMVGMSQPANPEVSVSSVNLLSNECLIGHSCVADKDGIRNALLVSLSYGKDPVVRRKALEGLKPYVGQDQRVRDVVLEALMHDKSASVRTAAIGLLVPVQSDSSVRQVLRTVSTRDDNPYIRTASFQALQGAADIE